MNTFFRIASVVLVLCVALLFSACKGANNEIDVPIDSSSNISSVEPSSQEIDSDVSNDANGEAVDTDSSSNSDNPLDTEIQTGQDVVIDMGEELF